MLNTGNYWECESLVPLLIFRNSTRPTSVNRADIIHLFYILCLSRAEMQIVLHYDLHSGPWKAQDVEKMYNISPVIRSLTSGIGNLQEHKPYHSDYDR
jgi:hypothetical protein